MNKCLTLFDQTLGSAKFASEHFVVKLPELTPQVLCCIKHFPNCRNPQPSKSKPASKRRQGLPSLESPPSTAPPSSHCEWGTPPAVNASRPKGTGRQDLRVRRRTDGRSGGAQKDTGAVEHGAHERHLKHSKTIHINCIRA